MANEIEDAFHREIEGTYYTAAKLGYRASYFLKMIKVYGGLATAHRLLKAHDSQSGLSRLWELGRLDISVEALVLLERWAGLFSDEERRVARERLEAYGLYI